MASEPFEVTDDNGITVTGTVDVYRDPNGPFFDLKSEFYQQPRYADAHFDFFNTREACTIDRKALSEAMQQAFRKALEKFQIPGPNPNKVRDDVEASINATRQQCIRNADKYVSNETFSSTNWETGKAVGNLTAKAYAAVPTPDGGVQTVVARENSWPTDDVSALKNYPGINANIRDTSRVAPASGIGNVFPAPGPGDTSSPVLRALQRYRPTAAPDGSAWTSAQGASPATPAFRRRRRIRRSATPSGIFPAPLQSRRHRRRRLAHRGLVRQRPPTFMRSRRASRAFSTAQASSSEIA